MNTKAFFPCGDGSILILGTGIENQIFFLRTPATVKFFFTKLSKNDTFAKRSIIIFQGVLTKFNFSMTFPHKEKIVDLMKDS